MFRLVATALVLSVAAPCFSEEKPVKKSVEEIIHEHPALAHVGYGYAQLLAHKPELAALEFNEAFTKLDPTSEDALVATILGSFGQAAAYDQMGMRDEAKQAIGTICLLVASVDDDEEDESDEDTNELEELTAIFGNDSDMFLKIMRDIALSAPSTDIQKFLLLIVDDLGDTDDDEEKN